MRRDGTARLEAIRRIGDETGEGLLALAAAVIWQGMHDAAHGVQESASDPEQAQAWLDTTAREWLVALRLAAEGVATRGACRVA